jgi:hypothetical protein
LASQTTTFPEIVVVNLFRRGTGVQWSLPTAIGLMNGGDRVDQGVDEIGVDEIGVDQVHGCLPFLRREHTGLSAIGA